MLSLACLGRSQSDIGDLWRQTRLFSKCYSVMWLVWPCNHLLFYEVASYYLCNHHFCRPFCFHKVSRLLSEPSSVTSFRWLSSLWQGRQIVYYDTFLSLRHREDLIFRQDWFHLLHRDNTVQVPRLIPEATWNSIELVDPFADVMDACLSYILIASHLSRPRTTSVRLIPKACHIFPHKFLTITQSAHWFFLPNFYF